MPANKAASASPSQMREGDRYIRLTLQIYPEDDGYVSECIELGSASCGDTMEEALGNIKDCVEVYLDTLEEIGERKRVFKERGIKIRRYTKSTEKNVPDVPAPPGTLATCELVPI